MNQRHLAVVVAAFAALSAQAAPKATTADVIVLMDESGSMTGEQAWMRTVVPTLDAELGALGLTGNRFGLTGFGASAAGKPHYVRSFSIGGSQLGSAADWVTASAGLAASGSTEDGWAALNQAATIAPRAGAARNIILVTDGDRDNTDPSLTFGGLLADMQADRTLLNVVVNNTFRCGDGSAAMGIIGTTGFKADGAGGFSTCTGAFASGAGSTRAAYVDLALATGGGAWNLNILRNGGLHAESFTSAFVAGKVGEIITQPPAVPEPTTWGLACTGLLVAGWVARRQRRGTAAASA